jgi:1-deoxyxylulose-5-phosphate synthase
MKYGTISGIDRPVSRIVLGSMGFRDDKQALADSLIEKFLDSGGNCIDTAYIYHGGRSERALGSWIRRTGRRDELLILTKGAHHDKSGRRVTPNEISFDLGASLERLGTSYVDLYVLHRDDPSVPVGPIVETLSQHAERGRIRVFGGSNWTTERLDEANAYAAQHDVRPFAVSSPNLGLAVPKEPMWPECVTISGDRAALDWYRRTQMPVLSWSSQSGGFFTGRFSPENTENADMVRVYYSEENWERFRRAEQLGRKLGYSTVQIALAWVLSQPDLNVYALIGPRAVDELESSLAAADLQLPPEQVRWLNLEA